MPELVSSKYKKIILLWKHRKKNLFTRRSKKNIRFKIGSEANPLKEQPVFKN
jgi:hypothetical protein